MGINYLIISIDFTILGETKVTILPNIFALFFTKINLKTVYHVFLKISDLAKIESCSSFTYAFLPLVTTKIPVQTVISETSNL